MNPSATETTDTIAVLDKGFVRLIDGMGDDLAVVQAARVSYASGSKGEEKDRKLISYLMRHQHMTPFEQAVFKFHVRCPIFVMRQWIRHRTGCLTGNTRLYFDLPSGPRNGRPRVFPVLLEEFHRKWHEGARPIPHARRPTTKVVVPLRERLERMRLRQLREDTGTFGHTRVVDVFSTGTKPVFEVETEDGKRICCTKDHRFLFKDGWKTLEQATGLSLQGSLAICSLDLPDLAVNGRTVERPLYRDREWLERQYSQPEADDRSIGAMLGVSEHVIRKWRKLHGLIGLKLKPFTKGQQPWNKGRTYRFGPRPFDPDHLAAVRKARSGARSNFWKGGVAGERAGIGRWTTDAAPRIFRRDGYRCRNCGKIGGRLHAHHVIPVWADRSKAFDESNLATLCGACHRRIHAVGAELEFAERLAGADAVALYQRVERPRPPSQRMVVPKWVRVRSIKYAGMRPTFDLTVEGPSHNYVADGIVTHNSFNEISARYVEVKDDFHVPEIFRAPDLKNKQSSQAAPEIDQRLARELLVKSQREAYASYQELLKLGVARELARTALPVSLYTEFYWTVNARNLMHFIDLRADAPAQWEIQRYAEALAAFFAQRLPWTWAAFLEHGWSGKNARLDEEKRSLCPPASS